MFFWVTFENRRPGTVQGDGPWYPTNDDRKALREMTREEMAAAHEKRREVVLRDVGERAAKFGKVREVRVLPYPANPRLDVRSDCPSFCWNPEQCAGRTCCPRPRSCDD